MGLLKIPPLRRNSVTVCIRPRELLMKISNFLQPSCDESIKKLFLPVSFTRRQQQAKQNLFYLIMFKVLKVIKGGRVIKRLGKINILKKENIK